MITVFGSINVDLVARVVALPGPGETVLAPDYEAVAGGKGANQAVAAARALEGTGVATRMIGCVGRDGFAEIALATMRDCAIDLSAGVAEHPRHGVDLRQGYPVVVEDVARQQDEVRLQRLRRLQHPAERMELVGEAAVDVQVGRVDGEQIAAVVAQPAARVGLGSASDW